VDTYDIYTIDVYDDSDEYTVCEGHSDLTLGALLDQIVRLSSGDWGVRVCKHNEPASVLVEGYTRMPKTEFDSGAFLPYREYV
jgi:hypothetical protein